MYWRTAAVSLAFLFCLSAGAQSPVDGCTVQHQLCASTCTDNCEKCESDYRRCKGGIKVDVDAANVRPEPPGLPPLPPSDDTDDGPPKVYRQRDIPHIVDGCSNVPDDPCSGDLGWSSTRFGSEQGDEDTNELAPGEAVENLPCNNHDICYQTCGADKAVCDQKMYEDMVAVCNKAYRPNESCPYADGRRKCWLAPQVLCGLGNCSEWYDEKFSCQRWATRYKWGLEKFGGSAYEERQEQYCEEVTEG